MRRPRLTLLAAAGLALAVAVLLHLGREPDAPGSGDSLRRPGTGPAPPDPALPGAGDAPEPVRAPEPARGSGFVAGTVTGKYGAILGVPVRALVAGKEPVRCRTDFDGTYRIEVPAGVALDLEARPEPWTKLAPMVRRVTVDPGSEVREDFAFGAGVAASGRITGPSSGAEVLLLAIRVEDYPPAPAGWVPAPELRNAPGVAAKARGTFTFEGLEPGATYRIAVDGYEWGLAGPVFLAPGDADVRVELERLLCFVAEVRDIEGSGPIARFLAKVVDPEGRAHGELHGRDGRLEHRARHPEQAPRGARLPEPSELLAGEPDDLRAIAEQVVATPRPPWRIVVEAEGYLPGTGEATGFQRVYLQRAREPNVLLRVAWDDGTPVDEPVEGTFDAAEQPDGIADARVEREGPGRFRAVMPPGSWCLALSRPADPSPRRYVRVDVPPRGSVTVEPPPLRR